LLDVREALRRAAEWNADRLAIVSGERELTFEQAWIRGLRVANALLELGLRSGDRVAVLEDNSIEASDFFLGTAAANLVRVPLYKRSAPEAHGHMVRHTGCRALVVSEKYLPEVAGIRELAPALEHVIVRSADYEAWLEGHSASDPNPTIASDDMYIIRHSGGTTGLPKGMAFSHRAWMNTERDWTYRLPPIEIGDACLHVAPISHGSGYLFVPMWISGGYNILEAKFEARRVLDLLSNHGGYFFAVPTIVSDVIAARGDAHYRFDKLKAIVIAGAPIRPQTAIAARTLFGDVVHQFYGQTEATPAVWMTPREWFSETPGSDPMLSVGRPMPFARVEVRDEENRRVAVNVEGELAIQTDGQMDMIWNEPKLTTQRLVDGWVLTGDIGRIDQNGYVYLVDRKDDLIISGGLNIWPTELELAISDHAAVREVAVIAAPHARWGETPIAIVVLHEGAVLTEADIIAICAARLGDLKRPTRVIIREEVLPRTPVGKLNRKLLREPFWAGVDRRVGAT
jgi:acyl-CoA synthetase (AMP-forming)/AMP-acid ligase II